MFDASIILASRRDDGMDLPYIVAVVVFSIVSMIVSAVKKRSEKKKAESIKPKTAGRFEILEEVKETRPTRGVLAQLVEMIERASDVNKPRPGATPPSVIRPPTVMRPQQPTRPSAPAARTVPHNRDMEPKGRAVAAHARTFHVSGESSEPHKPRVETVDVTASVRQSRIARIAPSEIGAIDQDAKPRRQFTIGSLKQAMVMKEILSPPVALRTDHN